MNLPQSIQPVDAKHVRYRGRRLVYFGGCDYYRLTRHPHLLKAHAQAVARDGLGTGASRMTTGNHPTHDALEAVLKKFFDCESATVIGDGYLANIALGQALGSGAKAFDALFIDEYAHLSLRDAAKFVGCPVVTYRHCDGDDLAKRLAKRKNDRQILLLTDGVFGATGRITPSRTWPRCSRTVPWSGWMTPTAQACSAIVCAARWNMLRHPASRGVN